MVKDKNESRIIIVSEANVSYLSYKQIGGKYANLNRDVDNAAEFSCNLYIA